MCDRFAGRQAGELQEGEDDIGGVRQEGEETVSQCRRQRFAQRHGGQ